MPMGSVVRLLSKPAESSRQLAIGSLNNLYKSVANLEAKYFAQGACKDILLNTRNSAEDECKTLKINIDDISPIKYYTCEDMSCTENGYAAFFSMYDGVKCRNCSKTLNRCAPIREYFRDDGRKGVFVKPDELFLMTDDLHVIPNVPASILAILENSGSTDLEGLEEKTFRIGCTEILDLLKYSILSTTPLTSIFLKKNNIIADKLFQPLSRKESTEGIISFKEMEVKVMVQKSNNTIILAHSSEDFIEFIFSFLTVPLGRVISLVSKCNAPALCVENIHQSVSNFRVSEFLKSQQKKDMLLSPKLSMLYQCSNQLFPLEEHRIPKFCNNPIPLFGRRNYSLTFSSGFRGREIKLASLMGEGGFLKGSTTKFMVTDDLVVTPFTPMSCMKYIRSCNVPPTDIEEQVINVGPKEALNLLSASLVSTSALTNGLKDSIRRKPMTERLVKKPKVDK
ncbi:uncharacterized protein LOC141705848 [Apium graveolens]|uniref:uncharacterized protein LOC141705848 n=1 Tax=Apium graveolens TaxID=4045 RepID=UPI003D78C5E0